VIMGFTGRFRSAHHFSTDSSDRKSSMVDQV